MIKLKKPTPYWIQNLDGDLEPAPHAGLPRKPLALLIFLLVVLPCVSSFLPSTDDSEKGIWTEREHNRVSLAEQRAEAGQETYEH